MMILPEAEEVLKAVLANIEGRSADVSRDHYNTKLVASLAALAGDGDTLEIGSYFGVSAITTSLLKQEMGIDGIVYCVDPLDGREQMIGNQAQTTGHTFDAISGKTLSPIVFAENCKRNGAKVRLLAVSSVPFPDELAGKKFTVAYIDGDHWHDTPLTDWNNVKDLTTRFVVFDDADGLHPHVMNAVGDAYADSEWRLFIQDNSICVFERKGNYES